VSGLLLYFAFRLVDVTALAERLAHVDLGRLSLLIPLIFLQTALLAWRWQMVLRHCGTHMPLPRTFRFNLIALFFNQALPSSIGGDAMRIWLAGRSANWRNAIYSVFLDRLIGMVALAALVLACLPWAWALIHDPVGRGALLVIVCGTFGGGIAFLALASQRLEMVRRWPVANHLAELAGVALTILRSPRALAPVFAISILVHLLTALVAWCAARAIGAELPLQYAVVLLPPVILVAAVPVSVAGWGLREGAMVAAFGYAGLVPDDGLMVSLLVGAGYLATGAIGGLVWVTTAAGRPSPKPMTNIDKWPKD
jgi:uncharacterized membrane protein YbhN (UPF0104 family)